MESVGELSAHRINSFRKISNIETSEGRKKQRWNPENLPDWLTPYVQNTPWAIRYAQLLNDGGEVVLKKLVAHLPTVKWRTDKPKPLFYMNASCSKKNWDDTVAQVMEWIKIESMANEVCRRIQATKAQSRAIYGICWRMGYRVIRHAVTVQELHHANAIKTDRFRFFCWLTRVT